MHRRRLAPITKTIDIGGAPLVIREWGDPGGTPLLFWHSVGPGGTGATFAVAAEPLASAGVRVIVPDAPGFGLSPARPAEAYGLERLGRLLWDVADAVGVDRAVVSGHSWGGAVAVAAAGLDGAIETRCDPAARGAVLYALTHERPSVFWPAIATAAIPTLVLLATEPEAVKEANERLVQRFAEAVPTAEIIPLEACRHQVFADLGPRSGTLVADWLHGRALA